MGLWVLLRFRPTVAGRALQIHALLSELVLGSELILSGSWSCDQAVHLRWFDWWWSFGIFRGMFGVMLGNIGGNVAENWGYVLDIGAILGFPRKPSLGYVRPSRTQYATVAAWPVRLPD